MDFAWPIIMWAAVGVLPVLPLVAWKRCGVGGRIPSDLRASAVLAYLFWGIGCVSVYGTLVTNRSEWQISFAWCAALAGIGVGYQYVMAGGSVLVGDLFSASQVSREAQRDGLECDQMGRRTLKLRILFVMISILLIAYPILLTGSYVLLGRAGK